MLQMVALKIWLQIATLLAVASTYCFEDQRFPEVLVGDERDDSGYYAATTNDEDLFIGGTTFDRAL